MNWLAVRCPDNETKCFVSPLNYLKYVACQNDSVCGIACDNIPDCSDNFDENVCGESFLCRYFGKKSVQL